MRSLNIIQLWNQIMLNRLVICCIVFIIFKRLFKAKTFSIHHSSLLSRKFTHSIFWQCCKLSQSQNLLLINAMAQKSIFACDKFQSRTLSFSINFKLYPIRNHWSFSKFARKVDICHQFFVSVQSNQTHFRFSLPKQRIMWTFFQAQNIKFYPSIKMYLFTNFLGFFRWSTKRSTR